MARARKHAAKDELHGRRARPDRVYRGEGLEPQQEDSRNAAIKCAKVQTLVTYLNSPIPATVPAALRSEPQAIVPSKTSRRAKPPEILQAIGMFESLNLMDMPLSPRRLNRFTRSSGYARSKPRRTSSRTPAEPRPSPWRSRPDRFRSRPASPAAEGS